MIALIEAAIVQRLRQGLGKLVTGVHSYGGELDDEGLYQVVQQLPAAWVTFAGIDKTEAVQTSRTKHKAEAKFVVMVAAAAAGVEVIGDVELAYRLDKAEVFCPSAFHRPP